ncbi:MAG: hypothetical protein RR394_08705, partial [Oscillospiraceae bacterium]
MDSFTVEKDGFFGELILPSENKYPDKAMIAFIGSNGDFANARRLAEYFADLGVTGLAIAYWNAEG